MVTPAQAALLATRYRPAKPVDEWLSRHIDRGSWDAYVERLTSARRAHSRGSWREVQERLLQVAALDTGALDGLYPANPELTARIAEVDVELGEPAGTVSPGLAAFANCQLAGYRMVFARAQDRQPVDAAFIRALHATMVAAQETYLALTPTGERLLPLPRGVYKQHLNYYSKRDGSIHAYAPPDQVAAEIDRLVAQLVSADFIDAHPVIQGAYVDQVMGWIHPFADANGRVGRALASFFLFEAVGVPLLVLADQWPRYLQALMAANTGSHQGLVDFVYARGVDAIDLAISLLGRPSSNDSPARPPLAESPPPSVLEAAAVRLAFDALWAELRERLTSPPVGVRLAVGAMDRATTIPKNAGVRAVREPETGNAAVVLALARDDPQPVRVERSFVPAVAVNAADAMPVGLWEESRGRLFQLSLGDVDPLFSDMARLRLRAWLVAEIADAYAELEGATSKLDGVSKPVVAGPEVV